jgi:hypothetical protein
LPFARIDHPQHGGVGKDMANPLNFVLDGAKENSSFRRKRLQLPANRVVGEPEDQKLVSTKLGSSVL